MLRDISVSAVFMGVLVAFVGFASSFAVVLEGLRAAGASDAQSVSGLMAASLAMGIGGIVLSLWSRLPVSVAWSTPGAALLIGSGTLEGGFPEAVGSFLVCGVALAVAGMWKRLGQAVAAIPPALANAMLAGILVVLCLAPFRAIEDAPLYAAPMLLAWAIGGAVHRYAAVPSALLVMVLVVWATGGAAGPDIPGPVSGAAVVMPQVTAAGVLGIALPLFVVTMASQNVPGVVILRQAGYPVDTRRWFSATGVLSVLSAPFGAIPVNLAAITAAMCCGEEAHRDPARRYWSATVAGGVYIIFGLFVHDVTAFFARAPESIVPAIAGLALIPAFAGASVGAFQEMATRNAAAVTFLTTASGVQLFGIGGAFWGLVSGAAMLVLSQLRAR